MKEFEVCIQAFFDDVGSKIERAYIIKASNEEKAISIAREKVSMETYRDPKRTIIKSIQEKTPEKQREGRSTKIEQSERPASGVIKETMLRPDVMMGTLLAWVFLAVLAFSLCLSPEYEIYKKEKQGEAAYRHYLWEMKIDSTKQARENGNNNR